MKLIAIALLASLCRAQPVIPAGLVYQVASQNGIYFIDPIAAQAILTQKSTINWRNVLIQAVGVGSLSAVTSGVAGIVAIPKAAIEGLAIGHTVFDQFVTPLLQAGIPSSANIAPILPMSGTLSPTLSTCAAASIFASSVNGQSAQGLIKAKGTARAPISVGPFFVGGALVTYTAQPIVVLKNISGGNIRSFMPISVVACLQPPTPILTAAVSPCEICLINPDGANGVEMHTGVARAFVQTGNLRRALAEYNAAIRIDPDNATLWREISTPLVGLDQYELASAALDVAAIKTK